MGLLRSGGLTLIAIVLFLMLLVSNSLLAVSMSLNYQNLEPELTTAVTGILEEQGVTQELDNAWPIMVEYCSIPLNDTNSTPSNFVFEGLGETGLEIPCETVLESKEAIIAYTISSMVEEGYYKDYSCSFWDCSVMEGDLPTHLFSQMARDYWNGKFRLALIAVIILGIAGFIIAEARKNYPFLLGGLFILSALPFIKINWFFSLFGNFEIARMLGVFFSQSFSVFLIMAIIGAVFILLGIALKFIGLGKFVDKLMGGPQKRMKAEVKQEVKKEMSSDKK